MEATVNRKPLYSVRELCYIAISTALIAICSWISIPVGNVPITLQTFAVFLVTGLLGFRCGLTSVVVYILLGAVGVPVFAGFGGGIGAVLGTTGGYIIGFLFTATVVGLMVKFFGRKVWSLAVGMVVGLALCYVFGTVWFLVVWGNTYEPIALSTALSWCVIPFLVPDAVKIALAIVLVNRLGKVVKL